MIKIMIYQKKKNEDLGKKIVAADWESASRYSRWILKYASLSGPCLQLKSLHVMLIDANSLISNFISTQDLAPLLFSCFLFPNFQSTQLTNFESKQLLRLYLFSSYVNSGYCVS